ncbi:MAG: hypothetical protein JW841_10075 [Deltaproteobacteria bacterium]|nr:hypothetical protein [Deltaproteobacteria bacterium]
MKLPKFLNILLPILATLLLTTFLLLSLLFDRDPSSGALRLINRPKDIILIVIKSVVLNVWPLMTILALRNHRLWRIVAMVGNLLFVIYFVCLLISIILHNLVYPAATDTDPLLALWLIIWASVGIAIYLTSSVVILLNKPS